MKQLFALFLFFSFPLFAMNVSQPIVSQPIDKNINQLIEHFKTLDKKKFEEMISPLTDQYDDHNNELMINTLRLLHTSAKNDDVITFQHCLAKLKVSPRS